MYTHTRPRLHVCTQAAAAVLLERALAPPGWSTTETRSIGADGIQTYLILLYTAGPCKKR